MVDAPPSPGKGTPSTAPAGPPAAPPFTLASVRAELEKPVARLKVGLLAASAGLAVALPLLLHPDPVPQVVFYVAFGATTMWFLQTWFKGPKLQFLNLSILFSVILLTIDYPNPIQYVALNVALGATLDAILSKWRFGEWRMPWPTMVGSLGISLVVDGGNPAWAPAWFPAGMLPFLVLPLLMVGSKHRVRWRGKHLFNPNNFAASLLILGFLVRIGVNDWGAAPQTLFLMLLFGTIATSRVKRFDLAVSYLLLSFATYWAIAQVEGWGLATVWTFAWSPIQVVIGFFAITDPATSPDGLPRPKAPAGTSLAGRAAHFAKTWPKASADKVLWAFLIVLLGVPATLAGRVEAPVFALLLAAPQRHLVTYLVRGKWPPAAPAPGAHKAPAAAAQPANQGQTSAVATAAATTAVLPEGGVQR